MKKVLRFFFVNNAARVYINDLARQLDADPKNLYRVLIRLEADGVLQSEFQGAQRYFFANRKGGVYAAYKALFMRSVGAEDAIQSALKGVDGLQEAFIFGSYAGGGFSAESDIDLLLIGDHSALAAEKRLKTAARQLGREINAVHLTSAELEQKKSSGDTFIKTIFDGKMIRVV